jgi:lipopolysaccharide export system permease protein
VILLALQLAVQNLSARDNAVLPMVWIESVLPGVICCALLLGPQLLLNRRIVTVAAEVA